MEKVTIFVRSEFGFGYTSIEAKLVEHGRKPYAQYPAAPYAIFVLKGARKKRRITQGYDPSMVIVEGWGHEKPPSAFAPTADGGMRSKHLSCSPEYTTEFNEWFAKKGMTVVADYRASKEAA